MLFLRAIDLPATLGVLTPTAQMVYLQMGDFVLETHGKESFEAAVKWIAESNCMTPQDLLSKYKKLQAVYDEAQRDAFWK